MKNIVILIMNTLTGYSNLTTLVPSTNMYTGSVDITVEKQSTLPYPQIVLQTISESIRTVPKNTRDSSYQIDIFSRNSQLEIENIYEEIINALNYQSGDESTSHLFWDRLGGTVDMYESDRRIWHRSITFMAWEQS